LAVAITLLHGRSGWGQDGNAAQIMAAVVERNTERQAALAGYTSERTYRIVYEGIGGEHIAQIEVHAEYRAPGLKHFTVVSESGSKPLCEKVLRKLVESEEESSKTEVQVKLMVAPDKYDAKLVGREKLDGVDAWVLDVTPKEVQKYTYSGRVWVSPDDFAVMRVVGRPAKNPSWLINRMEFDSRYERVGKFWLAAKNTTVSHVRLGGEARLTIDYGTYTIVPKPGVAGTMRAAKLPAR
jgi:hypothetical protein